MSDDSPYVSQLQLLLKYMTPEERLEVFADIAEGYCRECGCETPKGERCHCTNDE